MKLIDKISQLKEGKPFFTLEFFPPKTEQGFENLLTRISRLITIDPLAVSITWGAGGTTKDRTLDLAGLTQEEYGVDTILHLTCTNMVQGLVDDALRDAKKRGIHNVLALRGDPPRGEEYWIPTDSRFTYGVDLVRYIKSTPEFASDFCVGVAAYPDGHTDGAMSKDAELNFLKEKVDAGADFIITQLFYDVDNFLSWLKEVRARGIHIPIIPGIMPLQTYASFLRMTKLCGTRVPPSLMEDLVSLRHDDQQVKDYGVKLAVDMIRKLTATGDVRGVHFCTLNLERSVYRVLEELSWVSIKSPQSTNKLIAETPFLHTDRVVNSHAAADSATSSLITTVSTDGEAGKGELNNAAAWDDFPNGRFGDYKSPAYGETDLWGSSTVSRKQVSELWGHPQTIEDLTNVFLRHLQSKIPTTPFSPAPLSPESLSILPHLERLNRKGWWTVGSQPAIDGAPSTDDVVGWGPRGGYVYQKCFVEFFVEKAAVERIRSKIEQDGEGWVDYLAANEQGECWTNIPEGGRNAVTWGVFPGQEVTQTTIIEMESFLSWKEEAFSIWAEWASFYPPDSPERKLLDSIRGERWLISIVHHDYKDPEALWAFMCNGNSLA